MTEEAAGKPAARHRAQPAGTAAAPGRPPGTAPAQAAPATGMAQQAAAGTAAPAPPDDPQELQQEINRTREQLGQTVEALAAKTDVKARAQDKAAQLTGRLKGQAAQARQQAAERAARMQRQLAGKTAIPRRQAAAAAGKISAVTPGPVRRAVTKAAAAARQHRVPLAAATGAALAVCLVIARRGRR